MNNPTWDTILSTDGKGDEIFVVVDLQEMSATSNVAQATAGFTPWPGQTRDTFVYGDTNSFPSRKKAGSLSSQGGLRSGDNIPNVTEPWKRSGPPLQKEFPLFVWEGNLVDGQNAVLISPAIWEQDSADRITPIFNTAATIWGLTLKPLWDSFSTPGIVDQKALHRLVFGEEFSQTFTAAANTNLTLLSGGLGGVEFLKELTPYADLNPNNSLLTAGGSLFGESKDRPIGMIKSGNVYVFKPWIIPLNYATAEASLTPNSFLLRGPGIIEHRFVDAPEWAGDYTLYLQIERVQ
ncbi:MAG: hypothetical protein E4G97_06855 [Deltaproteobacteria bacterium]|nr:MAG: hypothetical protein E4G97_06855 [Deltaproteobacteria bacterium]